MSRSSWPALMLPSSARAMKTEQFSQATQRVLESMPREIDALKARRTREALKLREQVRVEHKPCNCYECRQRGR